MFPPIQKAQFSTFLKAMRMVAHRKNEVLSASIHDNGEERYSESLAFEARKTQTMIPYKANEAKAHAMFCLRLLDVIRSVLLPSSVRDHMCQPYTLDIRYMALMPALA